MSHFEALDATWPAAATHVCGPFLLREGAGGGKRVSAATCERPVTGSEIADAEDAMAALGQTPLFMVRGEQPGLDDQLSARRYEIIDPVVVMAAPVAVVAGDGPPPVRAFPVWPPMAIQRELWAAAGVGPARQAIMDRAQGPKISILGRIEDRPAGTAFVALHGDMAMAHAVETAPRFRKKGCATNMMRAAGVWAAALGAARFAVLVMRDNLPAQALYASLGMQPVGQYHYRIKSA